MTDFVKETDGEYLELIGSIRWSRDERDRRILPTEGSYSSALAEVALPGSGLRYYRTRLSHPALLPRHRGLDPDDRGRGRLR